MPNRFQCTVRRHVFEGLAEDAGRQPHRLFSFVSVAIPHLKTPLPDALSMYASVMAQHTDYGLTAYCASKAGVTGYTRTLALELGSMASPQIAFYSVPLIPA